MTLSILLLGPPRLELDGSPVEVDTRKATALMAYLVVTETEQSRDVLAALLWPEHDRNHARGALRRTLSTLKSALGGHGLMVGRTTVALDPSDTHSDVRRCSDLLDECSRHGHGPTETCPDCIDPLTAAAALHRGQFMAGFALRDSPAFDDWQYFEGETARRQLATILERLTRGVVEFGRLEKAVAHARRWLSLDPLDESAHRRLMELYEWSGQHAAAIRQYRECVALLERELGVAPLEETTSLYEAIKEGKAAPVVPAAPAQPPPGPAPGYPLVGREREWTALVNAHRAINGGGKLVIIEGEAGIGKTRLAEEFGAVIEASGGTVLAARAHEGESDLAYGVVSEVLRAAIARTDDLPSAVGAQWVAEIARLLPEMGEPGAPAPGPIDTPGARARLLEAVARVVTAVAAGARPGMLFIDDLQWADEASLDTLAYLVRRLDRRPLLVVVARREEHAYDSPSLRRLRTEARPENALILGLGRLRDDEATALLDEAGTPVSIRDEVCRRTEGLPLFIVEYLRAVQTAHSPQDLGLPGGVREVLRRRLAAVSETGMQILTTAAVIGRSFDLDTLRDAAGRNEEETVVALEELLARGLIEETPRALERSPDYDFKHDAIRTFAYDETSLARRRLLHGRVADAMARKRSDQEARAAIVARHYQQAGRDEEAAAHFAVAADHARRLFANSEALGHIRTALALGHPERTRLHEDAGDLLTLLGDYGRAVVEYETAAALGERPRPEIDHKLGTVRLRNGDYEAAEADFRTAMTEAAEPALQAVIGADAALCAHLQGRAPDAIDRAERALARAEEAGDPSALARAHNVRGVILAREGRLEPAVESLQRARALAEEAADRGASVAALNNLALAHRDAGDLSTAIELTECALELCREQGDLHRQAALENNLADLLHALGRSEAAMDHLKRAAALFADVGEEGGLRPEIWKLVEW